MASAAESFLQKIGKTDFNDDESLRSLAQTFAFVKDKLVANPSHHAPILSQCRMPQNAAAAAMVMYVTTASRLAARSAKMGMLRAYF